MALVKLRSGFDSPKRLFYIYTIRGCMVSILESEVLECNPSSSETLKRATKINADTNIVDWDAELATLLLEEGALV